MFLGICNKMDYKDRQNTSWWDSGYNESWKSKLLSYQPSPVRNYSEDWVNKALSQENQYMPYHSRKTWHNDYWYSKKQDESSSSSAWHSWKTEKVKEPCEFILC